MQRPYLKHLDDEFFVPPVCFPCEPEGVQCFDLYCWEDRDIGEALDEVLLFWAFKWNMIAPLAFFDYQMIDPNPVSGFPRATYVFKTAKHNMSATIQANSFNDVKSVMRYWIKKYEKCCPKNCLYESDYLHAHYN